MKYSDREKYAREAMEKAQEKITKELGEDHPNLEQAKAETEKHYENVVLQAIREEP